MLIPFISSFLLYFAFHDLILELLHDLLLELLLDLLFDLLLNLHLSPDPGQHLVPAGGWDLLRCGGRLSAPPDQENGHGSRAVISEESIINEIFPGFGEDLPRSGGQAAQLALDRET